MPMEVLERRDTAKTGDDLERQRANGQETEEARPLMYHRTMQAQVMLNADMGLTRVVGKLYRADELDG